MENMDEKKPLTGFEGTESQSSTSPANPDMEAKKAELNRLYKQSRLSNRILLILIVLYIVALFFFNNWIFIILLCIPMIGLAVWDHQLLKKMRNLNAELDENLSQREKVQSSRPISDYTTLNQLPKQYTVLDQIEVEGKEFEHIILSPYGVVEISPEDLGPFLAEYLEIPSEDISWISDQLPIGQQVGQILSRTAEVLDEKQIYELLYRLTGLRQ